MNRSILIVICDFLVLAVLSLSTGVGGSGTAQGVRIPKASAVSMEKFNTELRKKTELQKEKEAVETELQRIRELLEQVRKTAAKGSEKLENTEAGLKTAEKNLEDKIRKLRETERAGEELAGRLHAAESELTASKAALEKAASEKSLLAKALSEAEKRTESVRTEVRAEREKTALTERKLSYAEGRLESTGRTLSDTTARYDEILAKLHAAEIALAKTSTELVSTKGVLAEREKSLAGTETELVKTRGALSLTSNHLAAAREGLAQTEERVRIQEKNLADVRIRLSDAEEALRSDAWTKYAKALREFRIRLRNERLMNDFVYDGTFYLPEVLIGGKPYLVSEIRTLAGLRKHPGYSRVTELEIASNRPGKPRRNAGSELLLPEWNGNIVLIPLEEAEGEPLRTISVEALEKRGLNDLTLFKAESSRATASLDGRISFDAEPDGTRVLAIRNSTRDRSELQAEPGDFVLTKQGLFAGIVVRSEESDYGRAGKAVCVLFPDQAKLNRAGTISLAKSPDGTCADFQKALSILK